MPEIKCGPCEENKYHKYKYSNNIPQQISILSPIFLFLVKFQGANKPHCVYSHALCTIRKYRTSLLSHLRKSHGI